MKRKASGITPYSKHMQEVIRIFAEFSSKGLSVHALRESYLKKVENPYRETITL